MPSSNPLHDLLAWSTSNTAPSSGDASAPAQPPRKIDPAILDHILGKNDATKMREAMDVADDPSRSMDDQLLAWDELELLVESLDNANDLTVLKLWPRIIAHFSSSSEEIQTQALWVAGTAVQNNPKSQNEFLSHSPLPRLLPLLTSASLATTRSKALYCLSSLVRHHPPAVRALIAVPPTDSDDISPGLSALAHALRDPDRNVRRKAAFLLSTLFDPSAVSSTSGASGSSTASSGNRVVAKDPEPELHPGTHDPSLLLSHLSGAELSKAVVSAGRKAGVLSALVEGLSPGTALPLGKNGEESEDVDEDFAESAWAAVVRAWKIDGDGQETEKAGVREAVKEVGREKAGEWAVGGGVQQEDWEAFVQSVDK